MYRRTLDWTRSFLKYLNTYNMNTESKDKTWTKAGFSLIHSLTSPCANYFPFMHTCLSHQMKNYLSNFWNLYRTCSSKQWCSKAYFASRLLCSSSSKIDYLFLVTSEIWALIKPEVNPLVYKVCCFLST